MANIHPEALVAALAAAAKTPPPGSNDQMSSPGGGGGSAAPGGQTSPADPSTQAGQQQPGSSPGDPNAQGQDPNEQAVWSEFPATDPSQVEALAQQMQGASPDQLVQLLGSFMQQADADNQKLSQMHEAMLQHLMELLSGPGADGGQAAQMPQGATDVPSQGPGVGGAGTGY